MKRIALIAAISLVLLAGIGAGAFYYLKSQPTSSADQVASHPRHAVPSYSDEAETQAEPRKRILRLVEELGGVQDAIIRGNRAAVADQNRLLADISSVVRHFEQQDWDDYVNVRASMVYVLSGGDAGVLKPFVNANTPNDADQKLAHGIMDFAQGQTKAARKVLKDIDPRSLDVSLVGPFALARASLYVEQDPAKAIELFDEARLSSPHTAIEEAAARREIPLLVSSGDTTRAMMLAADYVRRFGKSIYARKLFRDFAEAVAKRIELDDAAVVVGLAAATEGTDPQVRTDFLLDMAGEALLRGRLVLAKAAAGEVLKIGKGSEEDLDKAKLYEAAAEAPSDSAADAIKVLDRIVADRLSDEDTEIREVAGYIARAVTGDEPANAAQATTTDKQELATEADGGKLAKAAELPAVASALENADATLKHADLLISGNAK